MGERCDECYAWKVHTRTCPHYEPTPTNSPTDPDAALVERVQGAIRSYASRPFGMPTALSDEFIEGVARAAIAAMRGASTPADYQCTGCGETFDWPPATEPTAFCPKCFADGLILSAKDPTPASVSADAVDDAVTMSVVDAAILAERAARDHGENPYTQMRLSIIAAIRAIGWGPRS